MFSDHLHETEKWRRETPVPSWKPYRFLKQNQVVRKVFCPPFLNPEKYLLVLRVLAKRLELQPNATLKWDREQEYLIRKNFKILNIASNGGGSGKLAMRQRFWCPPCLLLKITNGCLRCTAPGLASEQDRKAVILGLCRRVQRRLSRCRTLQPG